MDLREIKRLIKLVETSHIDELELQEDNFQIRITKSRTPSGSQFIQVAAPPSQTPQLQPQFESTVQAAKVEPYKGAPTNNLVEILSPMVGTFYRAPAPDAPAYVDVGDTIKPGKILCIVEAMKLMNEIEAEISGKIIKILAQNAQPVEYNQPLFLVEKQ